MTAPTETSGAIPAGETKREAGSASDPVVILARLWCLAEGNNPDDTISDAGHTVLDGTLGGLDRKALAAIKDADQAIRAALARSPAPAVPESLRRLSEAIQITDACVPGVYQYPVHGDGEWLVGWLFTKSNLDIGKRKVADLARLALEVRNLLVVAGDDEPLTSTDAVRHWEAEQAMAAGDPVTSSDALALWKVEQATLLASDPPSGRAGEETAPAPASAGGIARLHERECDALMQVISALGDLGEPWIESAGEASASGEKDHERRDMRVNSILTGAGNSLMVLIRELGPQGYFPRPKTFAPDPRLLTAARNRIDSLERRLSPSAAPAPAHGSAESEGWRKAIADRLVVDACDLPDRTSPEDQPEMLLITGEELHGFLMRAMEEAAQPSTPAEGR